MESRQASSKKDVTYQVSALGRDVTDRYARFRKELLISMTRATAGKTDFESLAIRHPALRLRTGCHCSLHGDSG